LDWCTNAEKGLPAPDICLYLELTPEAAKQRGDYGQERYETIEIQTKVRQQFHLLKADASNTSKTVGLGGSTVWHTVDASQTLDQVHQHIRQLALDTIHRVQHAPIQYF